MHIEGSVMNAELKEKVERNLFPRCRAAVEPWDKFKWHTDASGQCDTWKPHSSQALAIDLFGTIQQTTREERDAILGAVASDIGLPSDGPWNVQLEWEDAKNHLRESGKLTQVDSLATSPHAAICFECKFGERDGGSCSQTSPLGKGANKGKIQCNGRYELQSNPARPKVSARCALSGKNIRYWEVIPKVFAFDAGADLAPCPFSGPWYQWMRNLVLAHELGPAQGLPSRFVVVYADHPSLPFPSMLASTAWSDFLRLVRKDTVGLHTMSYQSILKRITETLSDQSPTWHELNDWICGKITLVAHSSSGGGKQRYAARS